MLTDLEYVLSLSGLLESYRVCFEGQKVGNLNDLDQETIILYDLVGKIDRRKFDFQTKGEVLTFCSIIKSPFGIRLRNDSKINKFLAFSRFIHGDASSILRYFPNFSFMLGKYNFRLDPVDDYVFTSAMEKSDVYSTAVLLLSKPRDKIVYPKYMTLEACYALWSNKALPRDELVRNLFQIVTHPEANEELSFAAIFLMTEEDHYIDMVHENFMGPLSIPQLFVLLNCSIDMLHVIYLLNQTKFIFSLLIWRCKQYGIPDEEILTKLSLSNADEVIKHFFDRKQHLFGNLLNLYGYDTNKQHARTLSLGEEIDVVDLEPIRMGDYFYRCESNKPHCFHYTSLLSWVSKPDEVIGDRCLVCKGKMDLTLYKAHIMSGSDNNGKNSVVSVSSS